MTARRLWTGMGAVMVATAMLVGGTATVASAKSKPLSKAAFIKAADKICAAANVEITQVTDQDIGNTQNPTSAQLEQFVRDFVPLLQQEHDDIAALPPPKTGRQKIKKILNTFQKEIDAIDQDPQELVSGEGLSKSRRLAHAYGFKVCGAAGG